jgi:hypothetical protein
MDEPIKSRYGIVNFERRKYQKFNIDLPVEYHQRDSTACHNGRAIHMYEEGLLLYLPELAKIGQRLRLKLFFTSGSELNTVEILTEVVWIDIHLEDWGHYRTGVRVIDISEEDMAKLKNFTRRLLG